MLAVLLTVIVFQNSVHAADKIRIAIPNPSMSHLTFPLAQKTGFFREDGLEAEIIVMRLNPAVAALVNGEIDYFSGIPPVVAATIRGVPVKILACYVPGSPNILVARAGITSVKELKGKTIAVTLGGSPHIIARMMVKHFGLDPDKDVKFLSAGPTESRFTVMQQGLADAAVLVPPFDFLGKKLGFVVVAKAYELFSYPTGGLTASVKKIRERPDESKRVIKAGIKAIRYIHQNREATIQFMIEWLKIDKQIAIATYESTAKAFNDDGSVPEKGLRLLIEEAKTSANVQRQILPGEIADLSILKEAQKELGIKWN
jgi:ABC-type nitrate/sulfonate/bicarbonate transport system substrate-binding protein